MRASRVRVPTDELPQTRCVTLVFQCRMLVSRGPTGSESCAPPREVPPNRGVNRKNTNPVTERLNATCGATRKTPSDWAKSLLRTVCRAFLNSAYLNTLLIFKLCSSKPKLVGPGFYSTSVDKNCCSQGRSPSRYWLIYEHAKMWQEIDVWRELIQSLLIVQESIELKSIKEMEQRGSQSRGPSGGWCSGRTRDDCVTLSHH